MILLRGSLGSESYIIVITPPKGNRKLLPFQRARIVDICTPKVGQTFGVHIKIQRFFV